jgi:hypothetical protein
MHDRLGGRQLIKTLVGDYKAGETPVPIPNTEVKLRLPMILLSGKVGNRRLHGPAKGNLGRATFVFGITQGAAVSAGSGLWAWRRRTRGLRGRRLVTLAT